MERSFRRMNLKVAVRRKMANEEMSREVTTPERKKRKRCKCSEPEIVAPPSLSLSHCTFLHFPSPSHLTTYAPVVTFLPNSLQPLFLASHLFLFFLGAFTFPDLILDLFVCHLLFRPISHCRSFISGFLKKMPFPTSPISASKCLISFLKSIKIYGITQRSCNTPIRP